MSGGAPSGAKAWPHPTQVLSLSQSPSSGTSQALSQPPAKAGPKVGNQAGGGLSAKPTNAKPGSGQDSVHSSAASTGRRGSVASPQQQRRSNVPGAPVGSATKQAPEGSSAAAAAAASTQLAAGQPTPAVPPQMGQDGRPTAGPQAQSTATGPQHQQTAAGPMHGGSQTPGMEHSLAAPSTSGSALQGATDASGVGPTQTSAAIAGHGSANIPSQTHRSSIVSAKGSKQGKGKKVGKSGKGKGGPGRRGSVTAPVGVPDDAEGSAEAEDQPTRAAEAAALDTIAPGELFACCE